MYPLLLLLLYSSVPAQFFKIKFNIILQTSPRYLMFVLTYRPP